MTNVPASLDEKFPPALQGIPLMLSVRVGTARKSVKDLAHLAEGTLMTLDSTIDDPVEICIDDRVIARGELVDDDESGGLAVKLTELVQSDDEK